MVVTKGAFVAPVRLRRWHNVYKAMPYQSWFRLKRRLVIACAGVTATGVLLITADIVKEYRDTVDRASRETANLARALDEQTYRAIAVVDRLIDGLARRAALGGSMAAARPALQPPCTPSASA